MNSEDYTAITERCFRGEPAPCSHECPFGLDVRSFLDKMARRRWASAYNQLRDATLFPSIVSTLCEEPCAVGCERTLAGGEALAIRELEAACLRNVHNLKPAVYVIPPKEQEIAVVGAGPAGLACALVLAQKRYRVTAFDKKDGWGGSLRTHPQFAEFDADIALQFSVLDVDFRYGQEVRTLSELAKYQAVYVATGAEGESFGLLDSWDEGSSSTAEQRVFLGGGLVGATLMESIAQSIRVSNIIEAFLQTGRATPGAAIPNREACRHYQDHLAQEAVAPAPGVQPSGPEGYTADEAEAEAGRCLQCDCDACFASCEMLRTFRKDPRRIAVEAHADLAVSPFCSRTLTRQAYSCNMCGRCQSVCPEDIDMGGLFRLSRKARTSAGIHPAALHDFWLREMDFSTTEALFVSAPEGRSVCTHVYFPGCQLGASRPEYVLQIYDLLAEHYDMGVFVGCCGAPAYWAGDEHRLQNTLREIKDHWESLGKPTFVFACATCSLLFETFLSDIPRVSVYELLEKTAVTDGPPPLAEAAVFDPCAARGATEMEAAVRALARKAGIDLQELPEKNLCCGNGGHIRLANPALYEEIVTNRAAESERPYVVYCANCLEVFATRGKPAIHVLELALDNKHPDARLPTLAQKRENAILVKGRLMSRLKNESFRPDLDPWSTLVLVISNEIQEEMERKLISALDLKEAIWRAESGCDKFCDGTDGSSLASLVRPVLTYWVRYREVGPHTYEVLDVYYHRVRIERGE